MASDKTRTKLASRFSPAAFLSSTLIFVLMGASGTYAWSALCIEQGGHVSFEPVTAGRCADPAKLSSVALGSGDTEFLHVPDDCCGPCIDLQESPGLRIDSPHRPDLQSYVHALLPACVAPAGSLGLLASRSNRSSHFSIDPLPLTASGPIPLIC
ncbi:MAG: hypothetical protein Q8R92_19515 [Deltaproteobacteria bacterium]|nr:hypothetical protein [Deltaproteobacteria bacterium]